MIKRLKWNVLYGEDVYQSSDSSEASDDSAQIGTEEAKKTLERLVHNDPELSSLLTRHAKDRAESKELNDASSSTSSEQENEQPCNLMMNKVNHFAEESYHPADNGDSDVEQEAPDQSGANWRECNLCPGKRFLNDDDVRSHLASKKHAAALLRHDRSAESKKIEAFKQPDKQFRLKNNKPTEDSNPVRTKQIKGGSDRDSKAKNDAFTELTEAPSSDKKKQKAKRKLQLMKRRKWDRNKAQSNGETKSLSLSLKEVGEKSEDHKFMREEKTVSILRKTSLDQRRTESSESLKKRKRNDTVFNGNDKEQDSYKTRKIRSSKKTQETGEGNSRTSSEANHARSTKTRKKPAVVSSNNQ